MQVKRVVVVTAIVTERLKQEMERDNDAAMLNLNERQKEIETQSRRYMLQMPSAEHANAVRRQVDEESRKIEAARRELKERSGAISQLVIGEKIPYTQLEGYLDLKEGDNLIDKVGRAEIIIRDGVIEEIKDGTGLADEMEAAPAARLIQRG